MNFSESIKKGYVKKINPDLIRSKSLIKNADKAIQSAQNMALNETTSNSVFRELYQGLREYCEALGYNKGFKFLSHQSITFFLSDYLNKKILSAKFDNYRKLRNGLNYYGNEISINTVKNALVEIPRIIEKIKQLFEETC
jgi:hypothetical protein